jgi:hypothetical protein
MKTKLNPIRRAAAILPVALFVAIMPLHSESVASPDEEATPPLIQIALLLDTSNSMDGLIDQTKGQLWKIVNEFINARQNGRRPDLQVALFEYGKSSLPAPEGYLRMIQPLTTDLDKISEELFALKTQGGQEYCGWVIKEATEKLTWSESPDAYKAIFIAGNEPFTQGPVNYAEACKAAIEKGIIVNTIHCGPEGEGIAGKWQDGALLAEGKYMVIDQHRAVVHFEAPQDKEIARLGAELNTTYIAFGAAGREGQMRQNVQDANAATFAGQGSEVNRALFKASANYSNSHWDLVDACKEGRVDVTGLKQADLPPEMQAMSAAECKAYVETKIQERAQLQEQINRLNAERSKFVAEEMKRQNTTETLDGVMISAIREQAVKKNYRFD